MSRGNVAVSPQTTRFTPRKLYFKFTMYCSILIRPRNRAFEYHPVWKLAKGAGPECCIMVDTLDEVIWHVSLWGVLEDGPLISVDWRGGGTPSKLQELRGWSDNPPDECAAGVGPGIIKSESGRRFPRAIPGEIFSPAQVVSWEPSGWKLIRETHPRKRRPIQPIRKLIQGGEGVGFPPPLSSFGSDRKGEEEEEGGEVSHPLPLPPQFFHFW